MQVSVNIPDEVARQVMARGLSLESYVRELIAADTANAETGLRRFGPGPYTPEEAGRWIRENRVGNRLNGLTIRELIDAGRKY
jgi:hypothetical protein